MTEGYGVDTKPITLYGIAYVPLWQQFRQKHTIRPNAQYAPYMNLSILISSYNWDCTRLVQTLLEQLPEDAEIIVANDKSTCPTARKAYQRIAGMKHCRVYEPSQNLGRSRIRNRLFDLSSGQWLLFLDCDTQIDSPRFLQNYLDAITEHPADVYYGGMKNTTDCPQGCELRWTYESTAAKLWTADYRRQHPYEAFTTQNFMIRRDAFAQTGFPEEITRYGYEDTVLLMRLERKHKTIWHLDNRLIHLDMDTNRKFLEKTRQALRTLHSLPADMRPQTRMVRAYLWLKRHHLHRIFALMHTLSHPIAYRILCSRFVSLRLFQLYKLGYF